MVVVTRLTLHSLLLLSLILTCHSKPPKWCESAVKKMNSCIEQGYQLRFLENCPERGTKDGLSCGERNNCRTYEKAVVKYCGYTCDSIKFSQDGDVANKTLYIITPTYTRPTQLAELTIMARSLEGVPNVEWIVLEMRSGTRLVEAFLSEVTTPHIHLTGGRRVRNGNLCNGLRDVALDFMRQHRARYDGGVIHFANLDRVYARTAFEAMRRVKLVGVWPTKLAAEQFTCDPLALIRPPRLSFPFNLGSVGFSSTALLDSSLNWPISISDTAGISGLMEGLVGSMEEVEVISCHDQFVWYIPIQKYQY